MQLSNIWVFTSQSICWMCLNCSFKSNHLFWVDFCIVLAINLFCFSVSINLCQSTLCQNTCMYLVLLKWHKAVTNQMKGTLALINSLAPGKCGWHCYFQSYVKDWYLEHLLWKFSQVNATRPYWRLVNILSGNSLVLWSNKPLPEPILTHIYVTIWRL